MYFSKYNIIINIVVVDTKFIKFTLNSFFLKSIIDIAKKVPIMNCTNGDRNKSKNELL